MRRAGLAATDQLGRITGQEDLHWHSSDSAAYRLEVVGLSGTSGERTAYDALVNRLASLNDAGVINRVGGVGIRWLKATDPKKVSESIKPREIGARSEGAARNLLVTALIALSVTVGLLVWQTSSSFLVIVAGILFASFLDTCARALGSVMLVDRVWRLTLVVMILTKLIVLGIIWGAGKIPNQARVLMRVMDAQLDVLQQRLLSVVVDLFGPDGNRDFFPLAS